MPAFWSFSIAEFGDFVDLLISIWLVVTFVFLEKPFFSQLGKCDLMMLNCAGREMFSEISSAQWSAVFEIRSNCCLLRLNLEQRLSRLKSSHLMHTLFFFMKLIIFEFSVKIQFLNRILRAESSLGFIGLSIILKSFLEFLVRLAGIT